MEQKIDMFTEISQIEVVLGTWDYSSKLKGGDQYNESPADQ